MRFREALLIEGGTNSAVLCYGVFAPPALDAAFETQRLQNVAPRSTLHRLLDDGWPIVLLLNEIVVASEEGIVGVVLEAMNRMLSLDRCAAAVCMYDGAFGSYGDVFGPDTAFQTYAFAFSKTEPELALDSSLLASDEWCSIIAQCRRRLECCSRPAEVPAVPSWPATA
jgi:hypothetical protein